MELSTGVSLIPQSAAQVPVVPFADLANFISDCNPSPVGYMLATGEPYQSVAQHSESWYIIVPSPKKTAYSTSPPLLSTPSTQAATPAASDKGASPWQLQLDLAKSKRADLLGEPQAMHEKVVSTIIDCAKYTKQNLAPTIWGALYGVYGVAYSAVALGLRCTQMGLAAGVHVLQTLYSVVATMAYWAYAIPKYTFIYASAPFVKAAKLWYRISIYLYNLTIVQLYLIPLAYIALLAGVVGSVVGMVAGATVVAIQYVFPIVKSASTDFVDEFTTQQHLQQQPKEKSQVTVSVELKKSGSKKQEKRLLIATGRLVVSARSSPLSSPALTSTTPPDSAEPSRPPSPTYLTPENTLGSIENFSGKHVAYTSDYEDEPEPLTSATLTSNSKFKPISKKFSGDLLARNLSKPSPSTQDSPLYEDEDGYFNYHQNSITSLSDLISAAAAATAAGADTSPPSGSASLCNSAASTAVTSPLVPLLSPPGERRFKLARTRRESGSPPAVDTPVLAAGAGAGAGPGGLGTVKTLSPDPDDLSCFEEAVEGESETMDDSDITTTTTTTVATSATTNNPTAVTMATTTGLQAGSTKDGSGSVVSGDKQVVLSQKMFKNQFESIAEEADEP